MEEIAEIIERLINVSASLNTQIPDEIHMKAIRVILPEIRDELKDAYLKLGGENHWI